MRATLTYHSIDDSGSPISVSPSAFEAHLAWLTSGRVRVLPLDDIATSTDADAVALTFDDGFANAHGPLERLRAAGLPVTVFVVTGRAGQTNAWSGLPHAGIPTLPLMTWDDLTEVHAAGVSIGAHTRSHAALTDLGDAALEAEVAGCHADITDRLGVHAAHFAYPFGDVNARVAAAVRRQFAWAHTTEFAPLGPASDPSLLPRLDMYYFQTPGALEAWGDRRFTRRVAWIGARRLARHVVFGGPHPGGRRQWTR